jgi:prepilin-type N-terminal cleavage/methylation domain-containing protein
MARRRGFTLVEIVVALALALIVIGAIHRLLVATQRLSRAQVAQMDLQSNVRASALVIANELRELNGVDMGSADQTDVLSITGSGMTYRAARGIGFLCEAPVAGRIRIARSSFSGYRDPQPFRDGAYLFVGGIPDAGVADSWLPLLIAGVATNTSCPGMGGSAISLTTSASEAIAGAPAGTPLRIYETMELRLYQSEGQWWLGARSVSAGEAIQPVAGPFAGSDGLRLEYLNRSGAPTADPAAIKSVIVTVRGITDEPVAAAGGARLEEELLTQVTLRNAMRR